MDEFCCDWQAEHEDGMIHDHDCDNYDGAPVERWEVTTPAEVYRTEED